MVKCKRKSVRQMMILTVNQVAKYRILSKKQVQVFNCYSESLAGMFVKKLN